MKDAQPKGATWRLLKRDEYSRRVLLNQQTTMSLKWLKWIVEPLQMGTWTYVFILLNEKSRVSNWCK